MEASPRLGIPPLDCFLRTTTNYIGETSIHRGQKTCGPVIEVLDTATGSGKTHILYHIAIVSTLPREYKAVFLDGRDSTIIFIDSDGRFDAHRLHGMMKSYITRRCNGEPGLPEEDISVLVESAMRHVHIFRPNSSAEVITILQELPGYLLATEGHDSGDKRVAAVFIDSLSAFYWEDRRNETEPDSQTRELKDVLGIREIYATIGKELAAFCKTFGTFAVTTAWSLPVERLRRSGPGTGGNANHDLETVNSQLPQSWNTVVDVRLVVRRVRPEQRLPNTGSVQVESVASAPGNVSRNTAFEGRFHSPRFRLEHQSDTLDGAGVFRYRITDDGITLFD